MNLFHKGVNALKKYWPTALIVLGFAVFAIAGSLGAKRVGIIQHDLRASTSIDRADSKVKCNTRVSMGEC